jgi:hypothetical protein
MGSFVLTESIQSWEPWSDSMRFGCDTGNVDIATSALACSWEIRNGRLK